MNMNISGYITPHTSYGIATLNFLRAFVDLGHSCSLFSTGDLSKIQFGEFTTYVRDTLLNSENFSPNDISLRFAHQFDMATGIGFGPRVGYTFFEMDQLTKLEVNHLNSLDLVLVPSEWAKEVCIKSGVESYISVCPAGYDPNIFRPIDYMPKECVFLSVGKWEKRKQQDQIVEAFSKAFSPKDNVKLILSMDNPFFDTSEKKNKYKAKLANQINIVGRLQKHSDLARIIQQSYCFVAPSLAEGWNMPLLEAMACGKFTIATNYSGHTAFCDESTTLLINPSGKEKAIDGMWFKENSKTNCGDWITYNVDDLVDHMKSIYQVYQSGVSHNNFAIEKSKRYSWANSAQIILDKIKEKCL